jgi:hypothetical protein
MKRQEVLRVLDLQEYSNMLKDYFKEQLEQFSPITDEIYDKIEFKRVWSGEMMQIGDTVLFAYVYPKGEDDPKFAAFLERELDVLETTFEFVHYIKETIPALKFRGDNKVRNVQDA